MEDVQNANGTPEPQQAPNAEPQPEPVDTGRDVTELKAAINALQEQMTLLTDELRRKDPDANTPKPDFGAYFKEFMRR